MNDFDYSNEIIEIDDGNTNENNSIETENEVKVKKKKKNRRSLKEVWNGLTKKKKIAIIVSSILILLLIIGIIVYFVFFRKDEEEKPKEEEVIVEKDNYRYENGKLIFLDKSDKEIGSYECTNKDSEKCFVAKLDYSNDSFDRVLNVYEDGTEITKNSQIYYDNIVFINDGDKIFIYNISNKESDLTLKSTEENLVVVEDNENKYGLLKVKEDGYDYLIKPIYDNLGIVNTELVYLVGKSANDEFIIDSTGKKLSGNFKSTIKSANNKFVVAQAGNSYNLYDYKYNELLSDYDYISLHNDIIGAVKGSKLYLYDNEINKVIIEGLKLNVTDYQRKYIYSSNNKLMDSVEPYEIEIKDNEALVTVNGNTENINLLEGKVSNKYSYLNYFDGKLYFYSDEEKEDLVGVYNCTNKNGITSANSNLDNCNIYNVDNTYSGIYNNRYVFINDNISNGEIKYYLYDLKEKKVKGTYNSIEMLKSDELSDTIKQIYTSSSFILAKSATGNNKGNFGVLEIGSEKVSGKVEFKYSNITHENNYYLLENVDKTYSIYNEEFKKISNEFAYLKLYEKYYVGINNNKLNIYSYTDTKGILKEGLAVTNNEYEIDFTDGFKIKIGSTTYEYDESGEAKDKESTTERGVDGE